MSATTNWCVNLRRSLLMGNVRVVVPCVIICSPDTEESDGCRPLSMNRPWTSLLGINETEAPVSQRKRYIVLFMEISMVGHAATVGHASEVAALHSKADSLPTCHPYYCSICWETDRVKYEVC